MNDVTTSATGHRIPFRGRMASYAFSVVFGPPFAGCILYFMLIATSSPGAWFNPRYDLFELIWRATMSGAPPAAVAGALGVLYFRKSATVPFWGFLGVAFVAVVLMSVFPIAVGSGSWEVLASALLVGLAASLPAALSAMMCWRITKRWHSPVSTP